MPTDTNRIFDKEILVTAKPANYYITMALFIAAIVGIISVAIISNPELSDLLFVFFLISFVALILYANIGQYLAIISLYNHRIEVKYLFPWNRSFIFEFEYITDFDFKDIPPIYQHRDRWHVGGKWLYFKNEKGETCQFKYNINNSDDRKFRSELLTKSR